MSFRPPIIIIGNTIVPMIPLSHGGILQVWSRFVPAARAVTNESSTSYITPNLEIMIYGSD